MAPEVFRHELYNNKVDVYSWAMIAYQLAEGLPPFWNMDPIEAARAAALEHRRPAWGPTSRGGEVVSVALTLATGADACCRGAPAQLGTRGGSQSGQSARYSRRRAVHRACVRCRALV